MNIYGQIFFKRKCGSRSFSSDGGPFPWRPHRVYAAVHRWRAVRWHVIGGGSCIAAADWLHVAANRWRHWPAYSGRILKDIG